MTANEFEYNNCDFAIAKSVFKRINVETSYKFLLIS